MPERDWIERLDAAINGIIEGSHVPAAEEAVIAPLLVVAADLRGLPDPEFKERLRRELFGARAGGGEMNLQEIRPGVRTLIPYLVVSDAARSIDFYKTAFAAEERLRVPRPDGSIQHAELRIGDSILEIGDASGEWRPVRMPLHFYVDDVDAVHARAVAAGAELLYAVADQRYGDREGGIIDPSGNHWYIATHQEDVAPDELMRRFGGGAWQPDRGSASRFVPQGMRAITAGARVRDCRAMVEFVRSVFGADPIEEPTTSPDGTVLHATLRVGDSALELGEARPDFPAMEANLHVLVDDADATYARALAAGATSLYAPADTPYGERGGGVRDPFGNNWFIATVLASR